MLYSFSTLLTAAVLVSLFTGALIGFPVFAILGGIFSALMLWFPGIYIAPLTIFINSPYTIMTLFGALGALGTFYFNYRHSRQPYTYRVVILSSGFIYHNPTDKKDRIACKYDEIISINIFLASYSSPIGSRVNIYYRYYVKNNKNYILSSTSLVLMRYIGNYILSMHWMRLKDLLESGKEVYFGDICSISKKHIRINDNLVKIEMIKEIKLYLSGEDDVFQIEFISGFRSIWKGGIFIRCEDIDNPHLFYKATQFVGIPLNLACLPELESHLKIFEDKA
ncbi:hypothetical protein OOK60_12675 [Trichothermofontia sichuanensis B231]|uniref:DUF6585 family protein n=1 Tax=Trichothermofontia sichuanensis TaxID=3045816 RepID=UPI002246847A|nr:DUF6585 family protein [Trichothermofontia sichuanensis]UZQ53355.1 hypothetical protein OOK60_12675 [Trichothermofontia sichuanensis B231]